MPHPRFALVEPLIHRIVPCSVPFSRRTVARVSILSGLGLAVFTSPYSYIFGITRHTLARETSIASTSVLPATPQVETQLVPWWVRGWCVGSLVSCSQGSAASVPQSDVQRLHGRTTKTPLGRRVAALLAISSVAAASGSETQMLGSTRVAIVTGANKGIGYHVADQLVKAGGLHVIIACRDPVRGQKAAQELGATYEPLDISNERSIQVFSEIIASKYGRVDILVNNAGTAFKGSDPVPFREQTKPTIKTNFWGTVALTDQLLPLLQRGENPKIVNVASMSGRFCFGQLSRNLQRQFAAPDLTRERLFELVHKFEDDVALGRHKQEGWADSNYGLSKLGVIAYTRLLAREQGAAMKVNSCCPGYCDTDMTSHMGPRPPAEGARACSVLALLPNDAPTGEFYEDGQVSQWRLS